MIMNFGLMLNHNLPRFIEIDELERMKYIHIIHETGIRHIPALVITINCEGWSQFNYIDIKMDLDLCLTTVENLMWEKFRGQCYYEHALFD